MRFIFLLKILILHVLVLDVAWSANSSIIWVPIFSERLLWFRSKTRESHWWLLMSDLAVVLPVRNSLRLNAWGTEPICRVSTLCWKPVGSACCQAWMSTEMSPLFTVSFMKGSGATLSWSHSKVLLFSRRISLSRIASADTTDVFSLS
ncbi:hypothetical protein BpHYR1_006540 [Brachionus plicatilis]|uniref:Secreted protein n=1 Tax=Brachionus plicatilis TaxID=10195 RepID=A0A3M7T4V1_BRAPC|nr:hypothetical protein BpHYR1_006540 [Brachionus plicatilis]